jgi:multimeric flavodoxin WrbA
LKILAIMGSPRKGNSYNITKTIEEKMKSLGSVDFEYLFLKDVEVSKCSGCHLCIMKGEEKCPYNSDILKIEKMMMEADGVIFVSPILTS